MQVTCPTCSASYEVPDRLLSTGGRRLRCSRCAGEFRANLPDTMPTPLPSMPIIVETVAAGLPGPDRMELLPVSEMMPPPAPSAPPQRRLRATMQLVVALLAWTASLGLAGTSGYLAISQRAQVMTAWAPSVRAYQALGLVKPAYVSGAASASAQTTAPEGRATSPPESHPG